MTTASTPPNEYQLVGQTERHAKDHETAKQRYDGDQIISFHIWLLLSTIPEAKNIAAYDKKLASHS